MGKDWDKAKDRIYRYYIKDGRSLLQVRALMKEKYHFDASIRSYKTKLDAWGYWKNHKHRTACSASRVERDTDVDDALLTGPLDGAVSSGEGNLPPGRSISPDWISVETLIPSTVSSVATGQNIREQPRDFRGLDQGLIPGCSCTNCSFANPSPEVNTLDKRDIEGKTVLHRAVRRGDVEDVIHLLAAGYCVHAQDYDRYQPLHYAAQGGHTEIIKLLLNCKANANASGPDGKGPLHLAVHSLESLKVLLKMTGRAVSLQDDHGNTPLHLALSLYFRNPTLDDDVVHDFTLNGDIVRALVESGADVNLQNRSKLTPFHMVVTHIDTRRMGMLVFFLTSKANISLLYNDVYPFKVFVKRLRLDDNHVDPNCYLAIRFFLQQGADSNTRLENKYNPGSLTLMDICSDDPWIFRTLCKRVNLSVPLSDGDYPLHRVFRRSTHIRSYSEHAQILLGRSADPNQLNVYGDSPLMVLLGDQPFPQPHLEAEICEALKILVEGQADVMLRDAKGNLPIYHATTNYRNESRKALVRVLIGKMMLRPPECNWWQEYFLLRQQKRWSLSTCSLLFSAKDMPDAVQKELPKVLLLLAAEDILQYSRAEFTRLKHRLGLQHPDTRAEQKHIVLILRECRLLTPEIEPDWLDIVLDMFP